MFLSGQVPGDALDASGQTREVLGKIDALLAEAGSDKDHLLSATIYLKNITEDFAAMNEVWSAWLSPGQAPSRTTSAGRAGSPAGARGNHRHRCTRLINQHPQRRITMQKITLLACSLGLLLGSQVQANETPLTGTLGKIASTNSITLGYRDASVPFFLRG